MSAFSTRGVSGKVPGIGDVSPSGFAPSSLEPEDMNPTTAAPAAAAAAVTGAAASMILSVIEVCVCASSVASVTGALSFISSATPVDSVLLGLASAVSVVAVASFSNADALVPSVPTTGSFSRSSIVRILFSLPSWSLSVGEWGSRIQLPLI